ncbi:MAG: hydratase [Lachnospiraceae bacterium]|nr:hydratase [Lachnospiraceae bacterium]
MIKLYDSGVFLLNGETIIEADGREAAALASHGVASDRQTAARESIAYRILEAHNISGSMEKLQIKFDQLASHDITYVGIIQTARASGLDKFPLPYVLTNCHNSLCAVGGTINEDDHMYGLTAAKKYGGVYVPPHQAVIHQYAREMMAQCGSMILGSDSHTRHGALGTMAVGEGGPELVKQLLGQTYDINRPEIIAVYLENEPIAGVGPQDVALALVGAVFSNGYVNNKVLEFVGPGVGKLSADFRIGVDVMTTETTCLSSIWATDDEIREFYVIHGRPQHYRPLQPGAVAYYDGMVRIDLSEIRPMIAMPFHPSNVYTIEELNANLEDILHDCEERVKKQLGGQVNYMLMDKIRDGKLYCDQGIIAGCSGGGFENICDAADILRGHSTGDDTFSLSVYPSSTPIYMELVRNGVMADLIEVGAVVKTAFCGPCFGAGDTPFHNAFSIRHTTRNFPNREGSKVQNGQISSVALMDARSIAATARNKGFLTPATDFDVTYIKPTYHFNGTIYENRVYDSKLQPKKEIEVQLGPNIKDWPQMAALQENLLLQVTAEIHDDVTTTDELIPSGETSSYRSNPLGLAEFALSRRCPSYVGKAKAIQAAEKAREAGRAAGDSEAQLTAAVTASVPGLAGIWKQVQAAFPDVRTKQTGFGSAIFAVKPGDGSAREQAASCQKVLGGWANIANEYATKRYRSNLMNWGMLPFIIDRGKLPFAEDDYIFIPNIRAQVEAAASELEAYVVKKDGVAAFMLKLGEMTADERQIILDGCLINYNRRSLS